MRFAQRVLAEAFFEWGRRAAQAGVMFEDITKRFGPTGERQQQYAKERIIRMDDTHRFAVVGRQEFINAEEICYSVKPKGLVEGGMCVSFGEAPNAGNGFDGRCKPGPSCTCRISAFGAAEDYRLPCGQLVDPVKNHDVRENIIRYLDGVLADDLQRAAEPKAN